MSAFVSLILCVFACNTTPEPASELAIPSTHAVAGVAPGSHADWCGEHAVPESECSRCDAALVPAFQATGDWCGEHGLPDSQCLQCSPDLKIERPLKEG
jgi:hypothetical protein